MVKHLSQEIQFRIQASVKYLRWSFCEHKKQVKAVSYFLNSSILDAWLGSKYTFEVRFSRIFFNKID